MTKTAVITGGTGGMGLATAKILGKDHRIVIEDLDQKRIDEAVAELQKQGIDASGAVCDITDRAAVDALLDGAAKGKNNHVRAVVHTAGVSPQMASAEKIALINGIGTVSVAQLYLERVGEGDVLVNVASTGGQGLPRPLIPMGAFKKAESDPNAFVKGVAKRAKLAGKKLHSGLAYALSKAFVIWYSRALAGPYGEKGARVVSVSPGSFDTAMGQLEADHGASDLLKTAAIKRFGKPEEIGSVLAYVASEAPGYLTGTDILVDGGSRAGAEFAKK